MSCASVWVGAVWVPIPRQSITWGGESHAEEAT